jgi:hypothetical protein
LGIIIYIVQDSNNSDDEYLAFYENKREGFQEITSIKLKI